MSQKQLGEIVSNEHISAGDGENINAKRIGLYGYDYAGGQWRRLAVNSSGSLLSGTVTSITGTANQVVASAPNGAVTLSTPQDIHTGASPTFVNATLSGRTATRVAYFTTGGAFTDSANMTFNGNRLALATQGSSGGLLIGSDVNIYRSAAQEATINDTALVQTRTYGNLGAGIVNALRINTSANGDGLSAGPDLRALNFVVTLAGSNDVSTGEALTGDVYAAGTGGRLSALAIMSANARMTNAMNVTNAYGYRVIPLMSGAGSITTWKAFDVRTPTRSSTGTITTSIGLNVDSVGIAGGTTAYGIRIQEQTNSATVVGLYFPGTTASVANGIRFNDVDVYRASANTLTLGAGDGLIITPTGSLQIPAGAGGGTVDASGEVTVDTTSRTLNFYDGTAEVVLNPERSHSFTIFSPTASSDHPLIRLKVAGTLTRIDYLCIGGTNWVGQIQEGDADGGSGADVHASDITATAGTTNSQTSFSNPGYDAGDWLLIKTTSVSGTPTSISITLWYRENA